MSRMERVLDAEVQQLLERLAATVPGGCLEATTGQHPSLKRRLEEVEGQMAAVRTALVEGYGRWRRSLDDLENLWALAAWKASGDEASYRECA